MQNVDALTIHSRYSGTDYFHTQSFGMQKLPFLKFSKMFRFLKIVLTVFEHQGNIQNFVCKCKSSLHKKMLGQVNQDPDPIYKKTVAD